MIDEVVSTITIHYFIGLIVFAFILFICLKHCWKGLKSINIAFMCNRDLTFFQNIKKCMSNNLVVLLTIAGILGSGYFTQLYLRDLKHVVYCEYVQITATIEFVNPESDSGGRTIKFRNSDTDEVIKIKTSGEEPPDKDGVYTVYYLPNTKIGIWILDE